MTITIIIIGYITQTIMSLRIFGISDLHLEFYPSDLAVTKVIQTIKQGSENLPDADVLVLAGDIGDPIDKADVYLNFLKELKRIYQHIIVVAGNHEHYKVQKFNISSTHDCLKKICDTSEVIFLEKDSVIINRVKFIGTTLWSKADASTMYSLGDFGRVFNDVAQYNEEFKKSHEWLIKELSKESESGYDTDSNKKDYDHCVVVTHHLPSRELCHEKFKNYKLLNTAFYTDILDNLPMNHVKYWFCGHTHEAVVKKLKGKDDSEVTVIVNPVGYPKEPRVTKISHDVYLI